jgi:hypothetical protein
VSMFLPPMLTRPIASEVWSKYRLYCPALTPAKHRQRLPKAGADVPARLEMLRCSQYLFARVRPLWWHERIEEDRTMAKRTSLREVLRPQIGRP